MYQSLHCGCLKSLSGVMVHDAGWCLLETCFGILQYHLTVCGLCRDHWCLVAPANQEIMQTVQWPFHSFLMWLDVEAAYVTLYVLCSSHLLKSLATMSRTSSVLLFPLHSDLYENLPFRLCLKSPTLFITGDMQMPNRKTTMKFWFMLCDLIYFCIPVWWHSGPVLSFSSLFISTGLFRIVN